MSYQFLYLNNIYLISIRDSLLDMTVNNPIFILSVITIIWYIPGILVRRIRDKKQIDKKKKSQEEAIERLYPKD